MLAMEHLDARRVLATLNLMASDGIATEENGTTVVTLEAGTTTNVTAVVDSSELAVQGYQLNFSNSNSSLVIGNFSGGTDFPIEADATLNSAGNDFFIASAVVGELDVPPTRTFGSFEVTIPNVPGDYRLTSNLVNGGELNNTILSTSGGASIPITDFGDLVFRVEGENLPVVSLSPTTAIQSENAGTVSLTATLSVASDTDVTIPFVVSGTATQTDDFSVGASPLTIPAGQTSATLSFSIFNDNVAETDETVIVTLQTPTGAVLGNDFRATTTIQDDDGPITGTNATLNFVPSSGSVTTENGVTVVTVAPGATVSVMGQIESSDQDVQTFQLNLGNSDSLLEIGNFSAGAQFPIVTDGILDSTADDRFVTAGLSGQLPVPPSRPVGTFDVTVPATEGDFRLTANSVSGLAAENTAILNNIGSPLTVTSFGDVIFRVQLPLVTIDPVSFSRDETSGAASFSISLSNVAAGDVSVPFSVSGSATSGSDYAISSSPVVIPAGQTSATISISLSDDSLPEADETVIVTLENPTGAGLGTSTQSVLTILDDDTATQRNATLDFIPSNGVVTQENGVTVVTLPAGSTISVTGQINTADRPVQGYQLNLSNSSPGLLLNNFSVGSDFPVPADVVLNTAVGDYFVSSALIGEVSVPPVRALGTFDVTAPTTPGEYRLTADFLTGSETQNTLLSASNADAFTITNFGDLIFRAESTTVPEVNLTPTSQSINENGGSVTLTATLSEPAFSPIVIPFEASGIADEDLDYTLSTDTLTIPAGQSSATIVLTSVDDTLDEPDETAIISLLAGNRFQLGTSTSSTITLIDDDASVPVLPSVSVTLPSQTASENAGAVTFSVGLSSASDADVTVPFTVSGSAVDGSDFTISSSPITIPAGNTSATVTIDVIDDVEVELDETVVVTLGTPTNATLQAANSHTLTIVSDDVTTPVVPTVTVATTSQSVSEGVGTATFEVNLSSGTDSAVTVPFTVTGTATDGSDFSITGSPVTIAAGLTSATVTISLVDDTEIESSETVLVTLGTPMNGFLGTDDTHSLTIVDNDDSTNPVLPTVSVRAASQMALESAGAVTFDVDLSFAADVDVIVPFSVSGTASQGGDFSIDSSPLTIAAGTTSVSVTIDVNEDSTDESNETVVVNLGTPQNATLESADTHTLTIVDNDGTGSTTRIIVPDIVPRPYAIPGDLIPTAIIFGAVSDTTVSVIPVGTTSLEETIVILDGDLNPISEFVDGVTVAHVTGGGLYAVIFEPLSEDGVYSLRAIDGEESLIRGTYTNLFMPTDTNADGETTPRDALMVINQLSASAAEGEELVPVNAFFDVNGDGVVSPLDALQVVNHLATQEASASLSDFISAEGEGVSDQSSFDPAQLENLITGPKLVAPDIEPAIAVTEQSTEAVDQTFNSAAADQAFSEDEDYLFDSLNLISQETSN